MHVDIWDAQKARGHNAAIAHLELYCSLCTVLCTLLLTAQSNLVQILSMSSAEKSVVQGRIWRVGDAHICAWCVPAEKGAIACVTYEFRLYLPFHSAISRNQVFKLVTACIALSVESDQLFVAALQTVIWLRRRRHDSGGFWLGVRRRVAWPLQKLGALAHVVMSKALLLSCEVALEYMLALTYAPQARPAPHANITAV